MPSQTGAVPVRNALDGPRITVDTFLNDPLKLQALVFQMTDQQSLADALLRKAGPLNGPAMTYHESEPLYADSDAEYRVEFGEVPIGETSVGKPKVAYTAETALAIKVSDEMRRWQSIDPVNKQLIKVKNTVILGWEKAFIQALLDSITQVVSGTSSAWSMTGGSASIVRQNIGSARKLIRTAKAAGQDTAYGFAPDTLIINDGRSEDLVGQEDFNKVHQGNIADENLLYTGKLPNKIQNLDVVTSRVIPDDVVIVLKRKDIGAIGDDLPLQTTALYRDEPRKTWRADVQRSSAIAIDQPLCGAIIDLN